VLVFALALRAMHRREPVCLLGCCVLWCLPMYTTCVLQEDDWDDWDAESEPGEAVSPGAALGDVAHAIAAVRDAAPGLFDGALGRAGKPEADLVRWLLTQC
jgi:hypothetical protein